MGLHYTSWALRRGNSMCVAYMALIYAGSALGFSIKMGSAWSPVGVLIARILVDVVYGVPTLIEPPNCCR